MIIKSYEVKKNISNLSQYKLTLLYGENIGLKKDIKKFISEIIKKETEIETLSLYENEILNNDENLFNLTYSGSLFSKNKIIIIYGATDKITDRIISIHEKNPDNVFIILFSEILEKKSKLRNFFEKAKKAVCIPCYLDSQRDLETIAKLELKKNNIKASMEIINLLVEKSNSDRNNLRNEIEKIISYSFNKKKIEFEEIKNLINFSGDYKSDIFINECLCGSVSNYKKIISELYASTINQILLFRILSNRVQCLLKIKKEANNSDDYDMLINAYKPIIFWKEKPIIKKQLAIWKPKDLEKIIDNMNNAELLCKKNPNISNSIFFNFFSEICSKANSFS